MIHCKAGLAGYYRMVATNAKTGKQRILADWFPNLITDYGLNILGVESWDNLEYCCVGSGNTTPTNSDTGLASIVAASNTNTTGNTSSTQNSPPYYGYRRRVIRFGEGVAAGNLTEVGMTAQDPFNPSSTSQLFSRALILDGNGNPTAITVLSNEFLDVTYELRLYPPLNDVVEVISDGATSYTVTTRACEVTVLFSSGIGWHNAGIGVSAAASTGHLAYDGVIGSITESPSGISDGAGSYLNDAYQNNSLERTGSLYFGLDDGNFASGIKSVRFLARSMGAYQAEFNPVIPKVNTQDLTIGIKVSWGRYIP
jgi:hypothetical protein